MWASTTTRNCKIAVHAENSIPFWISVSFQPAIEAQTISLLAKTLTMLSTATIDVIYRQEIEMIFATASAYGPSIVIQHFDLQSLPSAPMISPDFLSIVGRPILRGSIISALSVVSYSLTARIA